MLLMIGRHIVTDLHPLGEERVIGLLSHSYTFDKATCDLPAAVYHARVLFPSIGPNSIRSKFLQL